VLTPQYDALALVQVMPGGGAAEAGLVPGDAVVSIDGTAVVQLGFPVAIGRIRGPENSRVVLGVRRGAGGDAGTGPVVEVPVIRRRLQK
jgi:carboxyl-terminal processing protease